MIGNSIPIDTGHRLHIQVAHVSNFFVLRALFSITVMLYHGGCIDKRSARLHVCICEC